MGRLTVVSAVALLAMWLAPAYADNHVTAEDCQKITEGKFLLKAVPADVAESCRELAALAPAAGSADASSADPCAAENAGASVRCWGPWALLAPAADAGGGFPSVYTDQIPPDERPEVLPRDLVDGEIPEPPIPPEPPVPPVLPLGPCEAGASCGFATIINGSGALGDPDTAEIATFDLALDGSSFTVNAGEANEVQSLTDMTVVDIDRDAESVRVRKLA